MRIEKETELRWWQLLKKLDTRKLLIQKHEHDKTTTLKNAKPSTALEAERLHRLEVGALTDEISRLQEPVNMTASRKLYLAYVPDHGSRRVTSEFFTTENGFNDEDRQAIEQLDIDKLLLLGKHEGSSSVRRIR